MAEMLSNSKLEIGTFTDHVYTPSSRFRLRQYFQFLVDNSVVIRDYDRRYSTETAAMPNGDKRIRHSISLISKALLHESANIISRFKDVVDSNSLDVIWLSRQLIIGYPSFELLINKPLVYDIDDAIFLTGWGANLQFKLSSEKACAITAGNSFLAEEAAKYSKNVHIVPTTVDTNYWSPLDCVTKNDGANKDIFRIGWSGTSSSFNCLNLIQRVIGRFLRDFPTSQLTVMADRFPSELSELGLNIEFVKWNPLVEVDFVRSLDVGLMPLVDDNWSRGKCAYKMLLYAACGIPIVATPIGANKGILDQAEVGFGPCCEDEWYEALSALFADTEMRKRCGENGVKLVKDCYSVEVWAPRIERILRQAA